MRVAGFLSTGFSKLIPVVALSLFGVTGYSQHPIIPPTTDTPGAESGYSLQTFTQEVMVDVVVTDAKGEPVRNLTSDQFKVLEDGKPQQFRFFQENGNSKIGSTHLVNSGSPLPEHVYTNVKAPGPTVILLMDGLNTRMQDQMYMRQQVMLALKQLPAGTRIALFGIAPGLKQLVGLTTDPAPIVAALTYNKAFNQPQLFHDLSPTEQSQIADAQGAQTGSQSDQVGVTEARRAVRLLELRAGYTLDAFEALGKYLGQFSGRKSVIWFSASFPISVVPQSMTTSSTSTDPNGVVTVKTEPIGTMYADFSDDIRRVGSLLAASRVAVYPVDVRGVMGDPGYSAANAPDVPPPATPPALVQTGHGGPMVQGTPTTPSVSEGATATNAFVKQETDFLQAISDEHATMSDIADKTGGHAFFNSNDLSGVAGKALGDAASYYEIAYVPSHPKFDGKYHEIRVKLGVPGVKTSYRTGYFADDPKNQSKKTKVETDPLKAVLQDAAPESAQIPFYSKVASVTPQPDLSDSSKRNGDFGAKISGPVVRYGIDWNVKFSSLQTTAAANGIHQGQVTFAVVVYDSEGKTRNSLVNTLELNLTPARFAQLTRVGLPMHQELDLPMQDVVLRLAVIDRGSGKTGATEIPLPLKSAMQASAAGGK
jgi:VWFA-related protein